MLAARLDATDSTCRGHADRLGAVIFAKSASSFRVSQTGTRLINAVPLVLSLDLKPVEDGSRALLDRSQGVRISRLSLLRLN